MGTWKKGTLRFLSDLQVNRSTYPPNMGVEAMGPCLPSLTQSLRLGLIQSTHCPYGLHGRDEYRAAMKP